MSKIIRISVLFCLEKLLKIVKENKQTSVNLQQDNDTHNVYIVDEGNINYHLQHGTIEHTYFIDEKKEYATCQCGRVLHKKSVE
jgi:hypothetical protein